MSSVVRRATNSLTPSTGRRRAARRATRAAARASAHAGRAIGQRVRNAQPDGLFIGDGTSPASVRARAPRIRIGSRRGREQRARVRVHRPLVDRRPRRRSRRCFRDTSRRCGPEMWRTTDRSCAMKMYDRPNSCLQVLHQVDHLRLDRHVERADRLVGDDDLRVGRERARDADALPLAAGELVRIARRHALGDSPTFSSSQRDAVAALGRDCRRCGSAAAPRRSRPTVMRGFSDEYGSWKTIWMSARYGRICAPARARARSTDAVGGGDRESCPSISTR